MVRHVYYLLIKIASISLSTCVLIHLSQNLLDAFPFIFVVVMFQVAADHLAANCSNNSFGRVNHIKFVA